MRYWIQYKIALWRLYFYEKKLHLTFEKESRKEKSSNMGLGDIEANDYVRQLIEISKMSTYESTVYLLKLAEKLDIPTEDAKFHDDDYTHNNLRLLTTSGRHALRKEIRAEQARRRQPFFLLVTAITGLLGAATGLAAILLR